MDPCWLDSERVSQWIKVCDTTHTKCHNTVLAQPTKTSSQDMFLIHVPKGCLVKAHPGERYIALSYVWGPKLSQLEATKANVAFLRREGSLCCPSTRERLPGVIQRAMQLVSLLGVDLLWVDRLCIVQDDPVHTVSQINRMGSVYSHAYLTLCAADGSDAESGLRGVPLSSKPRDLRQEVLPFHGDQQTLRLVRPMPEKRVVYDERAWTFQETVLSRRILSFRDFGLRWECQEISYQEQCRHRRPAFSRSLIHRPGSRWPSVYRWAEFVFLYQKRRITYEHDTLNAFSGIMEAMSEYTPGGFHFGLPELFFDMALLWVPSEHLTRREGPVIGHSGFAFPSWSWAGWRGRLTGHFRLFEDDYKRDSSAGGRNSRIGHLIPMVKWFKIRKDTSELIQVCNDYDRYRDGGLRGDVELQTGWSSHPDQDSGRKYYRYHMADSFQDFWYPLPTICHPQPADKHTYQSVLFCRTWRVYLELGSPLSRVEQDYRADATCPVHWVTTGDGRWAGILYVHRVEDSARLNHQCELVVLSSHSYIEDMREAFVQWSLTYSPEMSHRPRPRSGDRYYFYNCLWIEWQNGIAYRKGIARVAKSVYDNLPTEAIDLYLG